MVKSKSTLARSRSKNTLTKHSAADSVYVYRHFRDTLPDDQITANGLIVSTAIYTHFLRTLIEKMVELVQVKESRAQFHTDTLRAVVRSSVSDSQLCEDILAAIDQDEKQWQRIKDAFDAKQGKVKKPPKKKKKPEKEPEKEKKKEKKKSAFEDSSSSSDDDSGS